MLQKLFKIVIIMVGFFYTGMGVVGFLGLVSPASFENGVVLDMVHGIFLASGLFVMSLPLWHNKINR